MPKHFSTTLIKKETGISSREASLLLKYGLTSKAYQNLDIAAKSCCQICGKHKRDTRYKNLSVDHCHKTNIVRGLLCSQCNMGLGAFKDSIQNLQKAIIYLGRAKKKDKNT